jgi:hypothetical protein
MNVKIISAILVLALVPLASMACGFTVDLPYQSKAGPEVKDSITVADPKLEETRVSLSFGAGDLNLSGGAEDLVDGTALYNVKDLKPEVSTTDGTVEIKQGNFEGLPPFEGMKNEWDLKFGKMPMDLVISAGAYQGSFELGGLSLKSLSISDGASDVNLSFSKPNLVTMSEFSYTTGASDVTMKGLVNANFNTFIFNSGAGNYTLDFSGDLQQDATVSIDCGFSDLTIVIPQGMHAIVTIDSALADISFRDGWSQKGTVYTQAGEGPTLTVVVNMGAGNVNIRE